jgi:protein-tyrosine phosphatase
MTNRNVNSNPQIGACYALVSVLMVSGAALSWPWGALLLWPATSCAILAIAYFGAGPGIYRKRRGQLSLLVRFFMAPVLVGQELSLRYYRRHGRPWDEATPELFMGRILDDHEAAQLVASGVNSVVDLTAEFSENDVLRDQTTYFNLPVLDLTAPTTTQLHRAVTFIRENTKTGVVYVHCKIGYSRTAAVVGAYLMAAGHAADADEAMAQMRKARSPLVIRPEVVTALHAFHARRPDPIADTPDTGRQANNLG